MGEEDVNMQRRNPEAFARDWQHRFPFKDRISEKEMGGGVGLTFHDMLNLF